MTKDSKILTAPPAFTWSHLWNPAVVNPLNLKSYTIPFFNLRDPYARVFHLSWLGFFVAFLSWFAFPPLIPDAIKSDLKLTNEQVNNSNTVALTAALVVRFAVGPMIDAFGPRKVMAGLLVLGAIPSGLAGTAHSANTLYAIRLFIGILGGTFVPCQAWTSSWFDKNCVGTVNALVGGWGNMGGGATFAIMASLYATLIRSGMTQHVAWRVSFAIVPLPCLLLVAIAILIFGQDHPAGKWSERQNIPATTMTEKQGRHVHLQVDGGKISKTDGEDSNRVTVHLIDTDVDIVINSTVDVAVNEKLTLQSAARIVFSSLTWLPTLAYLTTAGIELALDGQMSNILFALYNKRIQGFDQTKAGYYASIFGFLNVFTRPFGGFVSDIVYRKWGTKGKKYWMLLCGLIMGVSSLAGGIYLAKTQSSLGPDFDVVMGIFAITAVFAEFGNGANFALVPHCNSYNNGVMSGIVGSVGNLGGVFFSLVFRFQPAQGKAFWIMGIICIVINAVLVIVPVPKY